MALDVNMPEKPFENFDEFHAWYLGEIDKNLPVSIQEVLNSGSPSSYSAMLPHWSEEQEAEIYAYVEKMVSFPDDVYLEYAPDSHTIYSRWDTEDGVYRIALNTPMYFFMAYPPILKAGMVHEFGHIFNGDCLNHIPCHGQCSNICCDVRINAGIEERTLDELYSAIFYVKGECPFTPSRWYPKYALPVNEAGWPFEIAHNA